MKSENMVRAFQLFDEFEQTLRMALTDAADAKDAYAAILIYGMLEETPQQHWQLKRMADASR
jgi:DNA-binding ferritin-like protein